MLLWRLYFEIPASSCPSLEIWCIVSYYTLLDEVALPRVHKSGLWLTSEKICVPAEFLYTYEHLFYSRKFWYWTMLLELVEVDETLKPTEDMGKKCILNSFYVFQEFQSNFCYIFVWKGLWWSEFLHFVWLHYVGSHKVNLRLHFEW